VDVEIRLLPSNWLLLLVKLNRLIWPDAILPLSRSAVRAATKSYEHFDGLDEPRETIAVSCPGADGAFLFAEVRITHNTPQVFISSSSVVSRRASPVRSRFSTARPLCSAAHSFKFFNNSIPMVALYFDASLLDRSSSAKP
jgi:hypothetical protein